VSDIELRANGNNALRQGWPQNQPETHDARPETKHERFRRLASGRVQRALDALDQVAKLASSENEYSEKEAIRIVGALRGRLDDIERRLSGKNGDKVRFTFD
jgi:hypothetical protein